MLIELDDGELCVIDGPEDAYRVPAVPSHLNGAGEPYTVRQQIGRLWTYSEHVANTAPGPLARLARQYAEACRELARGLE